MGNAARRFMTTEEWSLRSDDDRAELIEGDLVYKAAPSAEHSFCAGDLSEFLGPYKHRRHGGSGPGGWWIGVEPHVIYPGRANGFIHDLAGWRIDRHPERPTGRRIAARPDWVCEILSSNRGDDLVKKKRVLHEHRVEHYWIIDHRDGILTAMRWVEGAYLPVLEATAEEVVRIEPFEGIEIDVGLLFGKGL